MPEQAAAAAEERQDWHAAARLWAEALATGEADAQRRSRAARALRMAGRLDEADHILTLAERLAPQAPGPAVERAWLTQTRGDWPRTLAAWQDVRARWPDLPDGYAGEASMLRVMERLDAADALVAAGAARFPANPMFAIERGWIAQQRGDWPAAARHWEAVRTGFPDLPAGHAGLARVLRVQGNAGAAARLLEAAAKRFPQDPEILTESAWLAQSRGELELAAQHWNTLRIERPHQVDAFMQQAACLRALGRPQEAGAVLTAGCAHHAENFPLHRAAAQLLLERHQWEAAHRGFAALDARWPEQPDGLLGMAAALAGRDALTEAEAILRRAGTRFPADAAIALALARLPVARKHHTEADWAETARRLQDVGQRFPSRPEPWPALIEALSRAGAHAAADAAAADAIERFPDAPAIVRSWADAARARGDSGETIRRLGIACRRHPAEPGLALAFAEALARHGAHAEATHALDRIPARSRGVPAFAIARATLATERRAWREAEALWAAAEQRFPHDHAVATAAARARLAAVEAGASPLADDPSPDHDTARAIVARFESLGGSPHGCEFGFVQRALALEPLGLLRWTGVPPARLIAALEAGFEGVGDPAQTELIPPASASGEYMLRDRRFGLRTHTHVTPADASPEDFFPRACLRQAFLRRRMLQRLAQGSHIFVYRLARHDIAEEELAALHGAIRAHGPGTLLHVRPARTAAEDRIVRRHAPGLLIGALARFAVSPTGAYIGAATEEWVTLCRRALALHGAANAGPRAATPAG